MTASRRCLRLVAVVKIIWALAWVGQLALFLLPPADNQLKCLCARADELSAAGSQLLSSWASKHDEQDDINKQVIGDNERAPKQLEDNRHSAGLTDDGWPQDDESEQEQQKRQHSSPDDLRAVHSARVLPDVTIPIIDNQKALRAAGAELQTNPLIGAARRQAGPAESAAQHQVASHYGLIEAGARERALDDHGDESSFLFQHGRKCARTRHLCQQLDETPNRKRVFCASDGRLYDSLCAMQRSACQLNVTLHRMSSLAHCQRLKWPLKTSDNLQALPAARSSGASASFSGRHLHQRGRCSRGDYEQFKLALWDEFNESPELLFNYFDLNADQVIEARELWPRKQFEAASTNAFDDQLLLQADFLFEPHFHWSDCALSHLMLYELHREGDTFDRNSFKRVFSRFEAIKQQSDQTGSNAVKSTRLTDTTRLHLRLGESRTLSCLSRQLEDDLKSSIGASSQQRASCSWRRRGLNLASLRDEHIRLVPLLGKEEPLQATNHPGAMLMLHLKDAQLYLSGDYECACKLDSQQEFIHQFLVQVTVDPHVSVTPQFQWSLPGSRVSLECKHDFIDTIASRTGKELHKEQQIDWFKSDRLHGRTQIGDSKDEQPGRKSPSSSSQNNSAVSYWPRASISMASSRLVLEQLRSNDTGDYECQVTVPLDGQTNISSSSSGRLLVQEEATANLAATAQQRHLWKFHEGGISVYRLNEDEGQELELVRELSGHHEIRPEVDGNWNQLTLCGGLNPEQAVICEWSDNAIELRLVSSGGKLQRDDNEQQPGRGYIYVSQPNLNRLLVLDGSALSIVAVVNTEPQPRKLFAFRPNKIHLNKWLRRRLSPVANARWLQAIERSTAHQQQAHPLELTPKSSRLYSDADRGQQHRPLEDADAPPRSQSRVARQAAAANGNAMAPVPAPKLVQYDIWLLCYGQPLVVDATGESASEDEQQFEARNGSSASEALNELGRAASGGGGASGEPRAATWPMLHTHFWLSQASAREARLRNRKSIQIIQSTFFVQAPRGRHMHSELAADLEAARLDDNANEEERHRDWLLKQQQRRTMSESLRAVNEFKRSSVLTTHYVMAGQSVMPARREQRDQKESGPPMMRNFVGRAGLIDLVQDLSVPSRPEWLIDEWRLKLHYAYAMHYEQRQLYRIAMDSYHYDRQLDLADCDPTSLLTTLQGQLVVQCRAPITHKPLGQLVLDELTGAKIQFNPNICAQDNYLSPDSSYLISVFNNQTDLPRHSTIIFVQLVGVDGLAFQYEIKTTLEIVQCSFVWKDGYYAAVFVALNRRDQQSELLSLRLADSRLELMVRVPGLVQLRPRHRLPLNIQHELKVASLSTSEGTHIVDLDENRIIQTLRQHHQSGPTLLWT